MDEKCFYSSRSMVDQMEVMFVYLSPQKALTRVRHRGGWITKRFSVHTEPSSPRIPELANTGEDAVLNAGESTQHLGVFHNL